MTQVHGDIIRLDGSPAPGINPAVEQISGELASMMAGVHRLYGIYPTPKDREATPSRRIIGRYGDIQKFEDGKKLDDFPDSSGEAFVVPATDKDCAIKLSTIALNTCVDDISNAPDSVNRPVLHPTRETNSYGIAAAD